MTDLQQRNEAFLRFLDTLIPAQREAVEQVEGTALYSRSWMPQAG